MAGEMIKVIFDERQSVIRPLDRSRAVEAFSDHCRIICESLKLGFYFFLCHEFELPFEVTGVLYAHYLLPLSSCLVDMPNAYIDMLSTYPLP